MRLAYADPPYPGQAKRHYGDHADYAGEVDLEELLPRLWEYDGWALSTSNKGLGKALAMCEYARHVRVLAWCKPIAPPFPGHGVYGWEPVVVHWARPPANDLRDTLTVSPEQYTFRPKPEGYVTGAKPPAFCRWLFAWLGAQPDDEFTDMYPGSRAVSDAWEAFSMQTRLRLDVSRAKPPCQYPLPDGRRCCECIACHAYSLLPEALSDAADAAL